jgi:hypothetical protein
MKAVPIPQRSTLEQFAHWFHQDFFFQFPDVQSGAAAYLSQLNASQRRSLRDELSSFLLRMGSEKSLRREWLKLGASAWPKRGDVRAELMAIIEILNQQA